MANPTYDAATDRIVITDPGANGTFNFKMRAHIPASVITNDITTVNLTSPIGGSLAPFTFGQPFKQGDWPAGAWYLSLDTPVFQSSVRSLWPDNSVKFAVISGRETLPANTATPVLLTVTSAAPAVAPNVAEPTAAEYLSGAKAITVTITGAGAGTYHPDIARTNGLVPWTGLAGADRNVARKVREFLGPVMSEFHYFQPCCAPYATTADQHLAIWWYVRAYSSGHIEVETVIENGWLKVAAPATKSYRVIVTIAGIGNAYDSGFTNLVHNHHARWSRVDWIGNADPQIIPAHDTAYLCSTKLVPNFSWRPSLASAIAAGNYFTQTNPVPFSDYGNYQAVISGTGSNEWIGHLPKWFCYYCTTADPNTYRTTIANDRIVGRYGFHFRDETTGRVHDWTSYQTGQTGSAPGGHLVTNLHDFPVAATGTDGPDWENAHHGSTGYGSYLISGRWTMLEELQFSAAWNISRDNHFAAGVIEPSTAAWTTRGGAWAWRTVGQAACLSPTEVEPALQASFTASLNATTAALKVKFIDAGGAMVNTVGYLGQYDDFDASGNMPPYWWGGAWMTPWQTYALVVALSYNINGINEPNLRACANHSFNGSVLRFLFPGTNATHNWRHFAHNDYPYFTTTARTTFLTTAQAYQAFLQYYPGALTDTTPNTLYYGQTLVFESPPLTNNTSQGRTQYKMLAIALAVDEGLTNAQAAFDFLKTNATNLQDSFLPLDPNDQWYDEARYAVLPR